MHRQKKPGYKFLVFIVVYFIASVGFPSFRFLSQYNFLLLPFLWYTIRSKRLTIPTQAPMVFFILVLFVTLHVILGHLTLIGGVTLVLTMAVAFFSAILLGRELLPIFVNVMRFFAITSLIIWGTVVLIPGFHSVLSDIASNLPQMLSEEWMEKTSNEGVSLYLYYLPTALSTAYTSFIRNNGPFYEPGLFASYLNIALVFSLFVNKRLITKENIPLILAILSTCSSAGYTSFMLIVVFSVFMQEKVALKIITVVAIIFLWQPVMELDFMADKIAANYDKGFSSSASRFGAMIYHWEKVQLSPIIGYGGGTTPDTNFDRLMGVTDRLLSPNGLTYLFVYWGIPLALYFYYLMYKGFKKLVGIRKKGILFSFYLVILSTAFSQTITTGLFILTLAALSFTLSEDNYENSGY